MAYVIRWSEEARQDLRGILEYISQDSIQNALSVLEKIEGSVDRLAEFPLSGHRVFEYEDNRYREVIVFQYRIIYRFLGTEVEVIAVIHGARMLPDALDGRV